MYVLYQRKIPSKVTGFFFGTEARFRFCDRDFAKQNIVVAGASIEKACVEKDEVRCPAPATKHKLKAYIFLQRFILC